ncbi:MAG: ABC transporter permease [Acidimicrobiales bacterium]
MEAVWLRFRIELRGRWRAWLALALLVGMLGGAVLALVAGARRTDSAYSRFLRSHAAYDMIVVTQVEGSDYAAASHTERELRRLPEVADVAPVGYSYAVLGAGYGVLVPPDQRIGTEVNQFKLLEGRRPDPRDPTEAIISFTLAEEQDLEIGSQIAVLPPWVLDARPDDLPPEAVQARRRVLDVLPTGKVTVVGIEAAPGEFPPQIEGSFRFLIHLSPALYPRRSDLTLGGEGGDALMVRLERGERDVDTFTDSLARLGAGEATWATVQRELTIGVDRSIHTQAVALGLLALLTAVVGGLVVGQLLARFTMLESDDHPALTALGMDRGQLVLLGLARAGVIGAVGSVVAVGLALALSRLFPTGLAAIAEPDPGWRFDAPVLGVGALALAAVVVALAVRPAWRSARVGRPSQVPEARGSGSSVLGRALAWHGLPAPAFAGLRMGLSAGRGSGAVPVRSSVAAMVVGVAAVVAAWTFGASLGHLLDTPHLYGHTWDVELTTYDESLATQGLPRLEDDERVTALAVGATKDPFDVDGHRVGGMAVDTVKGDLAPLILEGRRPRSADEIALGTRTLRAVDAEIGDTVRVGVPGTEREPAAMTVVGRAVFPIFSETGRLGEGVYVTRSGGQRIIRADEFESSVLVRLAAPDDLDEVVGDLDALLGSEGLVFVIGQGKPTDIVNFGRVEGTPYLLGGILAVLAAATLAHVLVTAIRRRRRELAILKTLGFDRRQVRSTVAWHATSFVAVALAVGVPLGLAAGRWVWRLFADNLGVVVEPRVPLAALLVVVAGAFLLANLIAVLPGTMAARLRPAEALRTE